MQPHEPHPELAIVILAGGQARRFPGKLEAPFEGRPLLAHVYQQWRDVAPTLVAGRGTFPAALDALLDCPIVVDRWPERGPLGGLLSAAQATNAARIFGVAGDAPRVTRDVLDRLLDAWHESDEAVVPEHDSRLEPLAALYDRVALMREASNGLHGEDASMHGMLARMRVRRVPLDAHFFANVNTAADLPRAMVAR